MSGSASGGKSPDTKFVGLTSFTGKILSIAAGLAFQVTVTRRLAPSDFALYQLVLSTVSYFVIPVSAISYWSARDASRGAKVIPTALVSGAGLSFASLAAYLAFSFFFSGSINAQFSPFIVGSFILIFMYESQLTQTISATVKPHVTGYVEGFREIMRVLSGFLLVYVLRLQLVGALLSWVVSFFSGVILGIGLLKEKLQGGLDPDAFRRWLRGWWLPVFGNVATVLATTDVMIVAILSSMMAVSYLSVATLISSVVLYTIALTSALYPQMLAGGSEKQIEEAFRFWLLFSVPMALGLASLAPAIANVLRREYAVAYYAIVLKVVGAFFATFGDILDSVTSGHEKLSVDDSLEGKPILSSWTLKVLLVRLISNLVYVVSVFAVLHFLTLGDVDAANMVCLIYAVVAMGAVIPKWFVARSLIKFNLPIESFVRYIVCFVPSLGFLWLFYPMGAFTERISDVLMSLIPTITGAAVLYFLTAAVVDPYFRGIVSSVINWVRTARLNSSMRGTYQSKQEGG